MTGAGAGAEIMDKGGAGAGAIHFATFIKVLTVGLKLLPNLL